MKFLIHPLGLALTFIALAFASECLFAGTKKVTICHIPPGNPSNAHTITVSQHAVAAHMAHGDTMGECGSSDGDNTETASFSGTTYLLCDDRVGEMGRLVSVSLTGRIHSELFECD
jgi:hypothetical protein